MTVARKIDDNPAGWIKRIIRLVRGIFTTEREKTWRTMLSKLKNAWRHHEPGRQEDGKVAIFVRDSGCGIPEENLDKIFEPLFSTKTKGIGLGLAIARRYARLNGGDLSVESEVGHGTTFRLTLRAG